MMRATLFRLAGPVAMLLITMPTGVTCSPRDAEPKGARRAQGSFYFVPPPTTAAPAPPVVPNPHVVVSASTWGEVLSPSAVQIPGPTPFPSPIPPVPVFQPAPRFPSPISEPVPPVLPPQVPLFQPGPLYPAPIPITSIPTSLPTLPPLPPPTAPPTKGIIFTLAPSTTSPTDAPTNAPTSPLDSAAPTMTSVAPVTVRSGVTTAPTQAPTTMAPTVTISLAPSSGPTESIYGTRSRVVTIPDENGFSTGLLDACKRSVPVEHQAETTEQAIQFEYELMVLSNTTMTNVELSKDFMETRIHYSMAKHYLKCRFDDGGDDNDGFQVQSLGSLPADTVSMDANCTTAAADCYTVQATITATLFATAVRRRELQTAADNITDVNVLKSFSMSLDSLLADSQLFAGMPTILGTSFVGVTNAPGLSFETDEPTASPINIEEVEAKSSNRGAIAGQSIGGVAGGLLLLALLGLVVVSLRRRRQRRQLQQQRFRGTWESDDENEDEIYGVEIDQDTKMSGIDDEADPAILSPAATLESDGYSSGDTDSPASSPGRSMSSFRQFRGPIARVVDPNKSFVTSGSVPLPDDTAPDQWQSVIRELEMAENYVHQPSPPKRKGYSLPDTMNL